MTLVSGPAIAKLYLRTRKWANESIRRGWFGPITQHKGVLYVDLRGVEMHYGKTLDDAQLANATEGQSDRILHDTEEAA